MHGYATPTYGGYGYTYRGVPTRPIRYHGYIVPLSDGYRYQEVSVDRRTGRVYYGRIRRYR